MADRVGQRLGNYTLVQLLGEGGFAEVYLGEHYYLKSQAAVKVLRAQLGGQEDMDSFLQEAQTIARLVHPNIIRVMDFGVDNQTPYLVMDYAPNGTLRTRHPRGTVVPLATVVPYVKQIADALQYAHDEHFIHRDVKPENMLLGRREEVLLSDFGIALVAQSSRFQNTQDVIGTVAYMAPEQIQGKPRAASDQYSLAVVVYEWLSGSLPFNGTFTEMCTQHMFAPPPPLREKSPLIPPTVERVLLQALAKDPHQRFASIQLFAQTLEQANLAIASGEQMPSISSLPTALAAEPQGTGLAQGTDRSSDHPGGKGIDEPRGQSKMVLPPAPSTYPQGPNSTPPYRQQNPAGPGAGPYAHPRQTPPPPQPARPGAFQAGPGYQHPPQSYPGPGQGPARGYPQQQQPMPPRHYPPDPAYPQGRREPQPDSWRTGSSPRGAVEGEHLFSGWLRPVITTGVGIIVFCIALFIQPQIYNQQPSLILAVPIFFGAAFGPLVGLLVAIGGVLLSSVIVPDFDTIRFIYPLIGQHRAINTWWSPFLISAVSAFLAGLSMLGRRRYPTIGSATRGTILGGIGLVAAIGFTLISIRIYAPRVFTDIGITVLINIIICYIALIIYSIVSRLIGSFS